MSQAPNRRVLVVDDNAAIHEDFRRILGENVTAPSALDDARSGFFGTQADARDSGSGYEIDSAFQGEEAVEKVRAALACGRPYALAFVDVRMPPGLDGVETIARLWESDARLQACLCTAYADYSWDRMLERLGRNDKLLILKKPFDPVEAQQIALALSEKWNGERRERERFDEARAAEQEARAYAASLVTVNRALETARAGAVAAAQAKSEFLANMSHEIRTPMIAILGAADLLREGELSDAERNEQLDSVRQEGEHLLTMIGDILDLSSIESGRLLVERRVCEVGKILHEVCARYAELAQAKGLTITTHVSESVPESIRSDPSRLRQILVHLVGNAVKFTEHGTVRVSADLERSMGTASHQLQIVVEDTGIGITGQQRGRLFEAFAQADSSLTRRHGGAGLGLALSRRIAHMLGGDLDVESESGRGSRFFLSLPVEMLDPSSTLPSNSASPAGSALRGRILLAEDVLATQRLYALYLRRAGAEVDLADNGQIAVEKALACQDSGRPYDLILMDMQMPILDGYSATRQLRDYNCQTPIVAVTAHALAGDREKCMAAGCNDYCAKPADRERLVAISREWIARSVPPALPRGAPEGTRIETGPPGWT